MRPEEDFGGGDVCILVECEEGGVFGRDEDPERFKESNFRMSVCEYAAPTTRPSVLGFWGVVGP